MTNWRDSKRKEREARQDPRQQELEELKRKWRERSPEEDVASFEAALTLFGTLFPDAYKRFADTAKDVQQLGAELERQERIRAKERGKEETSHDQLEDDLNARLEIELWRRSKTKAIRAALEGGALTQEAAEEKIRAIDEVADARLDAL